MQEHHCIPRNEQSLLVGVWAQTLMDGQALGIAVDADAVSNIGTSELDYRV